MTHNNRSLRARFKDIDGKAYDVPARNLLASHLDVANRNTVPEIRYEMVFEAEDDVNAGFTNLRVIVSAKTAHRVEALAKKALNVR